MNSLPFLFYQEVKHKMETLLSFTLYFRIIRTKLPLTKFTHNTNIT